MNILLCMPDVLYTASGGLNPPIGITYISSSLKAAGHNVYTFNFIHAKRQIHDVLFQMIADYNIEAVGCGDLVVNYESVKAIIDAAKEIKPDIITFIGGGLVTFSPVEAMTIIQTADYGIIGEGEITTCELIRTIEAGEDIAQVSGMIYRKAQGLLFTDEREDIPDLDNMPFPDYDGFLKELIMEAGTATVVTGRACPFQCTFCCHSGGKKFRMRSMDSIFAEIDHLVQTYGIHSLLLSDELFAINTDKLLEFCKRIKGYQLRWTACLRISEFLTLEIFEMMKEAGCVMICFGLESADDRILASMKKGITVSLMEKVLTLAKRAGVGTRGGYIFGDRQETMDSVMNTIEWVKNNHKLLDMFFLTPIICYPGSQLYIDAVNRGIIDPIDHILKGCPPVNVSRLSDEQYTMLVSEILPNEYSNILNTEIECVFRGGQQEYDLSISCPNCSARSEWKSIDQSILSSPADYEFVCDACNYREMINLTPPYTQWIDKKLEKILANNKCAIWPASRYFSMSFNKSMSLKKHRDDYILLNPIKNLTNTKMQGLDVHFVDVLREDHSFDTVIVFSPHYKSIVRTIQSDYPHVKPIVFYDIGLLNDIEAKGEDE